MNQNTQNISIDKIYPYERNAKKHPKKQVEQVANSIKEFGFNQPIVVDKNNIIIVGHGRYAAAKMLGMTEVPVVKVDLSPKKANAYRLADNKLNESDWDMKLVIEELKGLHAENFDITLTGFDTDLVLELNDNDDSVPALPKKARSKQGDVYQLGKHRIICGDTTKKEDVEILMGTAQADMVFTDPPYNIDYHGSGKKTSNKIMNDKMSDNEFVQFLIKSFTNMATFSKKGAGIYIFHDSKTQVEFTMAIEESGLEIKNQLIWNKPSAGLGMGDYRGKHEPFFYVGFKKTKSKFYGDRTHTSVIKIPENDSKAIEWLRKQENDEKNGYTTLWTMKRESVSGYVHPTQKPVELIMYALTNSSKEDDIVLDLFGGSGATLIACEKMGRVAHISELDPKYVDVMIQRWCDYTGVGDIIKNDKKIKW